MKRFSIICIVFLLFSFGLSAQDLEWMNGKWLNYGEIIEISDTTIVVNSYGEISSGTLSVGEANELYMNGEPIMSPAYEGDLEIVPEEHLLKYSLGAPLIKWESYSLPVEFSWVKGKWTDGERIVEITDNMTSVSSDKDGTKKGPSFFQDTFYSHGEAGMEVLKQNTLITLLEKSSAPGKFEVETILLDDSQTIRFSDSDPTFYKLPEDFKVGDRISDAFVTNNGEYDGDISWAYGEWHSDDATLLLRPKYYKSIIGEQKGSIKEQEKKSYTVVSEDNAIWGNVARIGEFYLDPFYHEVFTKQGFAGKSILYKTADYVSPTSLALKWGGIVLAVAAAVAAIFFLFRSIIRLIKKSAENRKRKREERKARKAEERAQTESMTTTEKSGKKNHGFIKGVVTAVLIGGVTWAYYTYRDGESSSSSSKYGRERVQTSSYDDNDEDIQDYEVEKTSFRRVDDVFNYLNKHTFKSSNGTTLSIRPNGISVSGRLATNAVRVSLNDEYTAIVIANTPVGETVRFIVNCSTGQITDMGPGGDYYYEQ